jgi:hypothetical protein
MLSVVMSAVFSFVMLNVIMACAVMLNVVMLLSSENYLLHSFLPLFATVSCN